VRFVVKFSLAAIILVGGYLFWPRSSSLSGFDAASMAELQVGIWRHAASKKQAQIFFDLYRILNGQYRIPPIPALSAAWSALEAQRAFADAADEADEEQALPFLEKTFSIIAEKTGSSLDLGDPLGDKQQSAVSLDRMACSFRATLPSPIRQIPGEQVFTKSFGERFGVAERRRKFTTSQASYSLQLSGNSGSLRNLPVLQRGRRRPGWSARGSPTSPARCTPSKILRRA
jgi:hypothetical protein